MTQTKTNTELPIAPDPRGFTDWEHGPDEFDRWADEDCSDDDEFDCHMGPGGYCGAAGSEDCEFECPYRREQRAALAKARQ